MTSNGRVVIIGGGATGALTAVALSEAGFEVVALEKSSIGNGSSSRSAACIRAQFETPETVIGMRYSEDWYMHFYEHVGIEPDPSRPMITQNGYLFLYESRDAARAPDAPRRRKHGSTPAGTWRCSSRSAYLWSCSTAAKWRRAGHTSTAPRSSAPRGAPPTGSSTTTRSISKASAARESSA